MLQEHLLLLQNRPGVGQDTVTEACPLPPGVPVTVDSLHAARELELWLSMSEFGEKERNYLFKSYTDLRVTT